MRPEANLSSRMGDPLPMAMEDQARVDGCPKVTLAPTARRARSSGLRSSVTAAGLLPGNSNVEVKLKTVALFRGET
jgi:hypothetical protein